MSALLEPTDVTLGARQVPNAARSSVVGIVEHLIAVGAVQAADVEQARLLAQRTGQPLSLTLDRLGLVSQQTWALSAAENSGYPLLRPENMPETPPNDRRLAASFLRKHALVPLLLSSDQAHFALFDPSDAVAVNALRLVFGGQLQLSIATKRDIDGALERLAKSQEAEQAVSLGLDSQDTERLIELANDAPTVRFVEFMLATAVGMRATDLHVEPLEGNARLRLRVDGVLQEREAPPFSLFPGVVSRLKIESNLDIAERRLSQDGRMNLKIAGMRVDVRVATAPTVHGEALTLRFLYNDAKLAQFDALDLPKRARGLYQSALAQPNGLVLVTGPTGSGKTTTQHAALASINDRRRKIITIEDPVEIRTPGLIQLEVNPGIGWTFGTALRSVLRHDPDIIMVGEIRDQETAELAIRAALTGHLVLSTLHANRAVDALTRLENIGIDRHLLMATLRLLAAQRLVRKLCAHCAEPLALEALGPHRELLEAAFKRAKVRLEAIKLRAPVGCELCNEGYIGRIAIHETLTAAEAEAILAGREVTGTRGLGYDGLRRIIRGQTTTEEVFRVAGTPDLW